MNNDRETILYKGYDPAFLFNFEREFPYATTKAEVMEFLNKYPEALVITKDKFHASDWSENETDRKSTRLNSSHVAISYAVFCLKKKKKKKMKRKLNIKIA